MFIVPAGLLVVGRCTKCGGRVERLVEFDDLIRPGVASFGLGGLEARSPHATRPGGTGPLGRVLQRVFGVLDEGHLRCDSSPGIHRVAPFTKQFLGKAFADASRDIESDDRTARQLYLLMEDGRGCAVGTEHFLRGAPAPSAERAAYRAAGVEAVRRYLKELDLTPAAAVLIGEAWASPLEGYETRKPGGGGRVEATVVSLVTARFGKATAGLSTASGTVGTTQWQPLRDPAPLTDGLFAQ